MPLPRPRPPHRCIPLLGAALFAFAAAAHADCTIFVTVNSDASGNPVVLDNAITVREAFDIARGSARCYTAFEEARITGGNFVTDPVFCFNLPGSRRLSATSPGCGGGDRDTIRFWDNIGGGPVITLALPLQLDARDSIDGAASTGGARPDIVFRGPVGGTFGALAIGQNNTFDISASGSVRRLVIEDFEGFGILATRASGLRLTGLVIHGIRADPFGTAAIALGTPPGSPIQDTDRVFDVQIGGTGAGEHNVIYDIGGTAVQMIDGDDDTTPRNNRIQNTIIGMCDELDTGVGFDGCPIGTSPTAVGTGIFAQGIDGLTIGGSTANAFNTIGRASSYALFVGGDMRNTVLQGNRIGIARASNAVRANGIGVRVLGGDTYRIGGSGAGEGNVISGNTQAAIRWEAGAGSGGGNFITGNVIGLNPARTASIGNGQEGIAYLGGGTLEVRGNVIAGNGGWGVRLTGGPATVVDNAIGLRGFANTASDNTAAANAAGGIWVDGSANAALIGNRIAGNGGPGVRISGEAADLASVRGNVIGLSNGNDPRPNTAGVIVETGPDAATIGGATTADRNTISGNSGEGVYVLGPDVFGVIVRNNYIGTTPLGTGAAPNGVRGVRIDGGATSVEIVGNVISGNLFDGIGMLGANAPTILGNTIGLDAAGAPLPNSASGVALAFGTTGAIVGDAAQPNTIAANAQFGVYVANAGTTGNTIAGNTIGGTVAGRGNGSAGVTVRSGATGNTVATNLIVGHANAPGIDVRDAGTSGNIVRGNLVGVTAAGAVAGNAGGVRIDAGASGNTIGGVVANANTISGNALYGITINGAGTNSNNVAGNRIGTNPAGTLARPNPLGVVVEGGASSNSISGNTISGNAGDAVTIRGAGSNGNRVQANRIGVASGSGVTIPNGGHGVRITDGASGSLIGTLSNQANLVRANTGAGIRVESGTGNDLTFNAITENGGLGIDIGPAGVTANDVGDGDAGANDLLNTPVLANVVQNGAMLSLDVGVQQGLPNTGIVATVHAVGACDTSFAGEGETPLGNVSLTTNGAGSAQSNVMLPLPSATPINAATATSLLASGSTSEFSPCGFVGAVTNAIFANGFESVSAGVVSDGIAAQALARDGPLALDALGAGRFRVEIVLAGDGGPARSLAIGTDRAVVVERVDALRAACALVGHVACEVPELPESGSARIVIELRATDAGLGAWLELRDATGAFARHAAYTRAD